MDEHIAGRLARTAIHVLEGAPRSVPRCGTLGSALRSRKFQPKPETWERRIRKFHVPVRLLFEAVDNVGDLREVYWRSGGQVHSCDQ